jgi:hypothetical protein
LYALLDYSLAKNYNLSFFYLNLLMYALFYVLHFQLY